MTEQNETQQPIDTLKQIRFIAQDLHDFATFCDNVSPGYIMQETAKITALVDDLMESAKVVTTQISDRGVSYWLKFAAPIEDVPEELRKQRDWHIEASELEELG